MKTENRNKIQKVFLTVANADIRPFHRDWLLTRILCEFKIKRLEVSKRVASMVNDSERRNRWNDSAIRTSSAPPLLLLRGEQHPTGRLRGQGCQADGLVALKVKTHFKTGICYVIWKPMEGVSKARNALRTV